MDFGLLQYLIPVVFLYYAYKLYVKKPAFGDERGGFPTRRARENEEVWNYVQRVAGIVCFVMAIILAVTAVICLYFFAENLTAYWVQIGIEVACIVLLIPIVNMVTNKKFPRK